MLGTVGVVPLYICPDAQFFGEKKVIKKEVIESIGYTDGNLIVYYKVLEG